MRCVAAIFIYFGTFFGCLPACRSRKNCSIKLDRSVYAFPPHIFSKRTTSSNTTYSDSDSANVFQVQVDIQLEKTVKQNNQCEQINWDVAFSIEINPENWGPVNLTHKLKNLTKAWSLSGLLFQVNFTVSAWIPFESHGGLQVSVPSFWFDPQHSGCADDGSASCGVYLIITRDNEPTVLFQTSLDNNYKLPHHGNSDLMLTVDNISSKVVVNIDVEDIDYFVNNSDRFEYCVISELKITLSALVTLSNSSTPRNFTLATNVDVNKREKAWWNERRSKNNAALVNVQFDFTVSNVISAINAKLRSLNSGNLLSNDSSSVAIVSMTLNVAATSGRTYPQKSNATFDLVLSFKEEILSLAAAASLTRPSLTIVIILLFCTHCIYNISNTVLY